MTGPWCWKDGALCPVEAAKVSVDDINFAYGYGVYETLKVRKGQVYFSDKHENRLFRSAELIGLEHRLVPGDLVKGCEALVTANDLQDSNLKVLLIGGKDAGSSVFWILALPPLFPDRKSYRDGGFALSFEGERAYPGAKSLNMLVSTLAFRKAQAAGAYDALLVDRRGRITEGTRTNFFWSDGTTVYTPPESQVLAGVTRMTVLETLDRAGIPWKEESLLLSDLKAVKGCFLTSTSTKVMPLHRVDSWEIPLDPQVHRIMDAYDSYLKDYAATLQGNSEET